MSGGEKTQDTYISLPPWACKSLTKIWQFIPQPCHYIIISCTDMFSNREAIINSGIIINFAKCFVITFWMYCSYLIEWFFSFKFHFKLTIGCFHTVATFRSRIVLGSQPSNLPDWLPVIKTVSFFVHSSLSFCTLP